MSDSHFHTPEALRALDDDALAALWSDVPTERQKAYRQAYDRAVRDAGASGADALELQVARELLRRYADDALVPVGSRWARTPSRVRQAAMDNTRLEAPDELSAGQNVPLWAVFGGGLAVLLLGWRVGDASGGWEQRRDAGCGGDGNHTDRYCFPDSGCQPHADAAGAGSAGRGYSRRGRRPAAGLPGQFAGQHRRRSAARVGGAAAGRARLRVALRPQPGHRLAGGRAVRASGDWRAVVGRQRGAVRAHERRTRASRSRSTPARCSTSCLLSGGSVRRSQTDAFRQVSPGLVLVLMGETDADGLPTGSRTLVTADYPPEQELSRSGVLADAPLAVMSDDRPTVTPLPFDGLDVQLVSVTTQPGRLTTVLRLFNDGHRSHLVTPDDITLALGYAPNPSGPQVPAVGVTSFTLRPGQAADVTLVWRWDGEPFAALTVAATRYSAMLP